MAKRPISTLKEWFETNDEPTQQQFADFLDSYWHLDAGLIITSIETLVGGKKKLTLSDGQAFEVVDAIEVLKVVVIDDAIVTKKAGNVDYENVEVGDFIRRYPTDTRYINARVDVLPHTVDANLSFFEDIELI